jgi:hypothetical protein
VTDETGWITVYHEVTGEVLYSARVARRTGPIRLNPGEAVVAGDIDGEAHWINPATRKKNLRRPPLLTIAGNRIANIPDRCWITVNGERVEPVDGLVTIAADLPEEAEVMIGGPRIVRQMLKVACEPGLIDAEEATIVLAQDYAALRRRAYEAAGLTVEAITFAQLDGDAAEVARITAARAAIKARIPKRKAP